MKKFTHNNDAFICEVCGTYNPPARGTCRNHCIKCLCSKHVDINPGDRAANCGGIMRPVRIELKSGLPDRIVHVCEKCGFQRPNKVAEDDDRAIIAQVLSQNF